MDNYNALVSVEQLTNKLVTNLIDRAIAFKSGATTKLTRPVYAMNLFFENSTRTHTSFEMAERKLGMTVLDFNAQASSTSKGETLSDTLKTVQAIGVDVVTVRHPQNDYYQPLLADNRFQMTLVNAGDGSGQHPSQCLLDLMTIFEEFGHFTDLKVVICGDLRHSRVARSNMQVLSQLGAILYFAGPAEWFAPEFAHYGQVVDLERILPEVDVVMLLRIQHERFAADATLSDAAFHTQYGLTIARAAQLKPSAIWLHPAPVNRDVEIATELVEAPQSRIFKQMTNGVFMRMAIIEHLLEQRHLIQH
ncbi:aspartate carbamoyltransferase catalytic subunit [Latilactobacillus graminis]|uniref:Aspartate carbamoyltransferase n=2 Tax=Latilactobacillus graminis TaxID=60519 RepID=A0AA89KWW2_9LACO|nr:aspartate carbamoyltransferase catalytic subunit [Latilactobacillus graminis]KRM22205.1 aspartate carbamoyltransferase [Latilactobacillus graminis DSM 20719]QFP79617.1 aspartate carbamoyltransferase catalytic subunit [Latilactobacillus graminis]